MGPIMYQLSWELNIFHLSNKHKLVENGNQGTDEVFSIGPNAEKPNVHKLHELAKESETIGGGFNALVIPTESTINPKSPSEKKINKNGPSMKATAQATTGVKELLLLDPP